MTQNQVKVWKKKLETLSYKHMTTCAIPFMVRIVVSMRLFSFLSPLERETGS